MINSSISKGLALLTTLVGLGFASLPAQAESVTRQETLVADMHTDMESDMQSDAAMMNIVEVASGSESFNTLVQAAQAAGLADTLASGGPFTVFAPTDEAFSQLPDGALEFLTRPENQHILKRVLTYHVVPGEITASEISTGSVEALGGGLAVLVAEDRVIVNNASVVNANIQASNGIIHAVNRVLMPRELRNQLVAALGQ